MTESTPEQQSEPSPHPPSQLPESVTSAKPSKSPRAPAFRWLFGGMIAALWLLVLALAFRVLAMYYPHEVQQGLAWVLGKRPHFEQDAEVGWVPSRNLDQTGSTPDGPGQPRFQTDSRGLRSPEVQVSSRLRRIVLLGDSMVWGVGVDQQEHVGAHLRQALQPPSDVLVAAAPGWSTDQEYLFVRSRLLALKPQVVIWCVTAVNDVIGNLSSQSLWGVRYAKPRFERDGAGTLRLKHLDPGATQATPSDRVEDASSMLNLFYTGQVDAFESGLTLTGRILKQAREEWAAQGTEVRVVIFKPNLLTEVSREVSGFAKAFGYAPDDFTAEAAQARLERLALASEQPVYYFDTQDTQMFKTDGHLSPRGHAEFAQFLQRVLEGQEAPRWGGQIGQQPVVPP